MEKILDSLLSVWEHEPAVIIGVVDAALMVGATFGLPLTPEQKTGIDTLLGALGVLAVRSQVTPNATVQTVADTHYVLGIQDALDDPTLGHDIAKHYGTEAK